ncbi:unnamed protein product [Withania somnifera]
MASTPASELSDGPVLSLINKRLRALRKKQNRILQMEESLSKGKTLNKEQEETLRYKSSVIANIDELEKLRQPLAAAVAEEINQASAIETTSTTESNSKVEDLLKLLYFGSMFDVKSLQSDFTATMLTRTMERACCLSYDCMPDDESSDVMDLLEERDLDMISMLSALLVSRPVNSPLSHKHALQKCIEHAKLWLSKSEQLVEPNSDVTYAGLRSKLDKIIGSLYFTRDPVKVEAAAGKYGSYSVPVEEHVEAVPVDAPLQVDTPSVQYEQKEVEAVSSQVPTETREIHVSNVELQQGGQDNMISQPPAKPEEVTLEAEGVGNVKDADFNEQQSRPRRSYQNQNYRGNRGGSVGDRRGYSNGRVGRGRGGSYQNGRNQYYDQSGHYQQINNNNSRDRDGRGTGGGGGYNHYASGDQADSYSDADLR